MYPSRIRANTWALMLALLVWAACQPKTADKPVGKVKLLVVHAGYPEARWVRDVHEGLLPELQSFDLEIEYVYMDTWRNPGVKYKVEAGLAAMQRYTEFVPDVVLVDGDDAQQYFSYLLRGRQTPVVFIGRTDSLRTDPDRFEPYSPTLYQHPAPNETGVLQRPNFVSALTYLRRVRQGVDTLLVLTDESQSSRGFLQQLSRYTDLMDVRLINIVSTSDADRWRNLLQDPRADAVLLSGFQGLRNAELEMLNPYEVMKWSAFICLKPTLAFTEDFTAQAGALALAASGEEHGSLAGVMIHRILEGAAPNTVPIAVGQKTLLFANRATADSLHIDLVPLETDLERFY